MQDSRCKLNLRHIDCFTHVSSSTFYNPLIVYQACVPGNIGTAFNQRPILTEARFLLVVQASCNSVLARASQGNMPTLVATSLLLLAALCGQNEATLLPILAAIKGKLLNAHRGIHQGVTNTHHFTNDGFETESETRRFQTSFGGDDDNNVGVQILRREAPLIHEIEVKVNEGLDAERNLTSVREEIRRELVEANNSGNLGSVQRSQMESRIRQLDMRLGQLRQKNLEAQRRFLDVIGSIQTGKIRSQRRAHNMLGGVAQFYVNVVMGYVRTCMSLCMGIVNFWLGLFGKFTGVVG